MGGMWYNSKHMRIGEGCVDWSGLTLTYRGFGMREGIDVTKNQAE
jgi:hypothetical protein